MSVLGSQCLLLSFLWQDLAVASDGRFLRPPKVRIALGSCRRGQGVPGKIYLPSFFFRHSFFPFPGPRFLLTLLLLNFNPIV